MTRLIVAGGGLAGCLAALAIAKRRPDVEILLLEQDQAFGGNHIWSFFDTDVPPERRWVLDGVPARHWPDHDVRFPRRHRIIPIGYNSIRSRDLASALIATLRPDQYRLGAPVVDVGATHVSLGTGERFEADAVLDARGPGAMPGQEMAWQKFVGRIYRFSTGHRVTRPMIMDATIPQHDGYRFLYFLPLSPTDLLIEDTYYSTSPLLDRAVLHARLDHAAANLSCGEHAMVEEESGVLPVLIDGDFELLWPAADPVPRLGVRGAFFHPTTGYSIGDAVANAALLAEQSDMSASALASLFRQRADRLWQERRFFQLLDRMLFRAAEPDRRYQVLEHFYRLPPGLIGRFYAARLTTIDKLRILSGRPPIPLHRAWSAIRGSAA